MSSPAMGHKARQRSPRRRILVMRYRFIGDTLLTVPFLRNLRAAYPDAKIDMLIAPNSGEVLRDCPYVDEFIVFDTTRKHRYENPDGTSQRRTFWSYVRLLRERHYDTAFVLKRSLSSAALAFLSGIPERIGFDTEKRGFLLTTKVPYLKDKHEIDCFLDILRAVDISVRDRHLESWLRPADHEKASSLLAELTPVDATEPVESRQVALGNGLESSLTNGAACPLREVVLHLTSSNVAKQWPMAQAKSLLDWLFSQSGCRVHCLGAPSDAALYEDLKGELPPEYAARVHVHCGKLDLLESMAFLQRMDLVIGVDSGTLHMAAAVHAPILALFGPMDERKWAPPGAQILTNPVPCRPCNLATPCHHDYICMKGLRTEAVIETIRAYAGFA